MMRDAWFLARRHVRHLLRDKETLLWLFLMPIVFFYFIGTVTGGLGGGGGGKDSLAVWVPDDAGFLAGRVQRRLAEQDYELVPVADEGALAGWTRRLRFPEGFTQQVLDGQEVTLDFQRGTGGLGNDYDQVRVGRAVYTTLADLVAVQEEGATADEAAFQALDGMPRALTLRVESAGKRRTIPTGFEQTVPGILVMFTMIVLLTSGATTLVVERNQGLFRRLAATPITRGSVVLGKWLGNYSLGLVQIAFAMAAGTLLFDMDWGPDLPMIFLVLAAYGALCASLGLLLGVVARTEGQAVGIGVFSANVLAALGGCWWPIEITPPWMQSLQKFLPPGQAMDALHQLVSFQAGAASAVPHVAVLVVLALGAGWLGARWFRYQ